MTKKTKIMKAHRDIIETYGEKTIRASIDRAGETDLLETLIDGANAAIRVKYPEADMVVLRKYKLERIDYCLRFQFPSGRVDGFSFHMRGNDIADMPSCRGCFSSEVFPVSEAFEQAYDEHTKVKKENDKLEAEKLSQFRSFLVACRYIEDVEEVIEFPTDIRERLGHRSTALVAVTAETVVSLKATFNQAA